MDLLKSLSQKHTNRFCGLTICVEEWDWVSEAGRVVHRSELLVLIFTFDPWPFKLPCETLPIPSSGSSFSPLGWKREKKKFLPLFSRISFWALFQIIFRVKCICFLSLSSPTMLSLNHRWGVGGTAQANSSLGPRVFSTFPYLLPQRGYGHLTSVI